MWKFIYRLKGHTQKFERTYPHCKKCDAEMAFWSDWYGGSLAVTTDDWVVKIESVSRIEG